MATVYASRLQGLRARMATEGLGALLVTRPEHRRYLSGFSADAEEDGLLVVTLERQWMVTDFRYIEQVAQEAPDFTLSLSKGQLADAAACLLTEIRPERAGFESEHMTFQFSRDLEAGLLGHTALVPVRGLVEGLRLIKDEDEIRRLREAAALADDAFGRLLAFIRPGLKEWEVAAELEATMRGLGSSKAAFSTIVASGARGALPHGVASGKAIEVGDLVTIDFGAVVDGYHSDMTRTIAVGEPGEQAREVYALVLAAQMAGLEAAGPGVECRAVDAAARTVIRDAGRGEQFGHGLGHGVGLMIHEGPRLSARSDETLKAGMVVTVEPGVYVAGWGGVRIEDLVVVTETGCQILSKSDKALLVV